MCVLQTCNVGTEVLVRISLVSVGRGAASGRRTQTETTYLNLNWTLARRRGPETFATDLVRGGLNRPSGPESGSGSATLGNTNRPSGPDLGLALDCYQAFPVQAYSPDLKTRLGLFGFRVRRNAWTGNRRFKRANKCFIIV